MLIRNTLVAVSFGLFTLACGDDPAPVKTSSGGSGGGGTSSTVAGTTSFVAGGGGASGGSASGSGGGGGSAGSTAPGDCALQGDYTASAEMKLPNNTCTTLGDFKTTYNISIDKAEISIEQFVEMVPMKGSIDADCHAEIVVQAPTYREFQLSFVSASLTASGTYIEADNSDCRSTYQASLKLTAK